MTSVVASMGTALTPAQLRELGRLTRRLYLCFDADAAGQAATLRGMDMAYQDFDAVLVVPLPPGSDPAESPERFSELLAAAEPYPRYRVKLEIDRARSKEEAFQRLRDVMAPFDQNTEWMEAIEYAAERLDLPGELQAALAPQASRRTGKVTRKILEAGDRLERDALAGVLAHPGLLDVLREVTPEHFDSELHQKLRAHLVGAGSTGPELTALHAELDARAHAEGIDETTARELLLRLRERRLRRELRQAEGERAKELRAELERIHEATSALV